MVLGAELTSRHGHPAATQGRPVRWPAHGDELVARIAGGTLDSARPGSGPILAVPAIVGAIGTSRGLPRSCVWRRPVHPGLDVQDAAVDCVIQGRVRHGGAAATHRTVLAV